MVQEGKDCVVGVGDCSYKVVRMFYYYYPSLLSSYVCQLQLEFVMMMMMMMMTTVSLSC